ncbi:hypothetical protein JCM11641_006118 [Rhodosporidiobolus odoratus]
MYLGEGIFSQTTLSVDLRSLPLLSSLTFGLGARVESAELLSLVSGPSRHPALTLLTLDIVNPEKRGYRVHLDSKGKLAPSHARINQRVGDLWELPEFTDPDPYFSTTSVEELIATGSENGVKVTGKAVEAIELYRDWWKEAIEALLVYGTVVKDYDELRVFVGEHVAAALLEDRGLDKVVGETADENEE